MLHDRVKGHPRHKCTRCECKMYCILPMFARRCMSDQKVETLFENLKDVIAWNPTLISSDDRKTEAKSAQNILRYISSFEDQFLREANDVLSAMSGNPRIILKCTAKVDSKLHELLFDLIRATNYSRLETTFEISDKMERISLLEDVRKSASLPWLNERLG